VQALDHGAHVLARLEPDHEIDEVLALEADRSVAVGARTAQVGVVAGQHVERPAQVCGRLDVAAGGNVDLRHRTALPGR
jgi:hypothetical protein